MGSTTDTPSPSAHSAAPRSHARASTPSGTGDLFVADRAEECGTGGCDIGEGGGKSYIVGGGDGSSLGCLVTDVNGTSSSDGSSLGCLVTSLTPLTPRLVSCTYTYIENMSCCAADAAAAAHVTCMYFCCC